MEKKAKILIIVLVFLVIAIPVGILIYKRAPDQASEPEPMSDPASETETPTRIPRVYITPEGSSYFMSLSDSTPKEEKNCLGTDVGDKKIKWCVERTKTNESIYTCADATNCKFTLSNGEYVNDQGKEMLDVAVDKVYALNDTDFQSSLAFAKQTFKFDMTTGMLQLVDGTPVLPGTNMMEYPLYASTIALFYKNAQQVKPHIRLITSKKPIVGNGKVIYITAEGSTYTRAQTEYKKYYGPIQSLCPGKSWCSEVSMTESTYATNDFDQETGKCKDGSALCKFKELDMDGKIIGYFNDKGTDIITLIVSSVYEMSDDDFQKSFAVVKLLFRFDKSNGLLRKMNGEPVIPIKDLLIPQYAMIIAMFYRKANDSKPEIRLHPNKLSTPTSARTVQSYNEFVAMMIAPPASAPAQTPTPTPSPSDVSNVSLTTETVQTPVIPTTDASNQVPSSSPNSTPTSTGPVQGNANAVNGVQGLSV